MRRPYVGLAAAAGMMAGLSACALNERIGQPDVVLPARFEAAGPAAPTPPQALDRWWRLFDDPQLTALVEEALVRSPDARSALGRVQEARASRREAIDSLLPKGDLTGSVARQNSKTHYTGLLKQAFGSSTVGGGGETIPTGGGVAGGAGGFTTGFISGDADTRAAAFDASWELDLFGRDIFALQAADADLAAQRFDYEATRISLAAEVADDLFAARNAATMLEEARENARLAHRLADVSRAKVERGLTAGADEAQLDADAATADSEVVRLDAELAGDRRALLVLVGRGAAPSAALPVTAAVASPPVAPVTQPGELLTRRPDVRRAEAQLRSASKRLRLDKLALLPTFTLQPVIQGSEQAYPGIGGIVTRVASAGVGFSQPVLSLPRLLAEVRVQGARGRQAVAAYEKAVQTAYGDAERGMTSVAADQRRVVLLQAGVARARYALDARATGYRLGLTDIAPLIQAEQAWRQARSSLTAVQTAALQDTVATFKALGGGWDYAAAASRPSILVEAERGA